MPQMWPSQWSLLFFLFLGGFIIFMVVVYFIMSPRPTKSDKSFTFANPFFPWQW